MTDDEAKAHAADGTAKFRVWWVPQIPMDGFYYPVPDYPTGKLLADALGQYDLFQYENNVKPDYANVGGVEWNHATVTEGRWDELEDDEAAELGLAGAPQ